MKRRRRDVERSLRERVETVVRADAEDWTNYLWRRNWRRFVQAFIVTTSLLVPLLVVGVGALAAGPWYAKDDDFIQTATLAIAFHSALFVFVIFLTALCFYQSLFTDQEITAGAFLPKPDGDQFVNPRSLSALIVSLYLSATVPFFSYYVWQHGIQAHHVLAGVVCLSLQFQLVRGCSIALARSRMGKYLLELYGLGWVSCGLLAVIPGKVLIPVTQQFLMLHQDAIVWPLFVLNPAAWIPALYWFGTVGLHWWGFLFGLPAAVLLWRFRDGLKGYQIRKFGFKPSMQTSIRAVADLQPGFAGEYRDWHATRRERTPVHSPVIDEATARRRCFECLTDPDSKANHFFARLVRRCAGDSRWKVLSAHGVYVPTVWRQAVV